MNEVLVMTALTREARAASRRLGDGKLTVHVIGIGAKHLPGERSFTAESPRPKVVVLAGYGGALSPDVGVGDVVIDDPRGRAAGLPFRYGRICFSSRILATVEEKHEAFGRTGALAVDMESEPVRQWADRMGADFIGVRAITDGADEPLNPKLLATVDEFGRPRPGVILKNLRIVPAMLRLAGATRVADAALGEAVEKIMGALAK